ncbi:MAG: hypothetical protein V7K48_25680 [Nostoc sp.]|uniref:hypothetical protein n=1 Tax=Nostoc sp. TaxID=1180 RepID=UPI002FF85A87
MTINLVENCKYTMRKEGPMVIVGMLLILIVPLQLILVKEKLKKLQIFHDIVPCILL